jgi:hypothetical protein
VILRWLLRIGAILGVVVLVAADAIYAWPLDLYEGRPAAP